MTKLYRCSKIIIVLFLCVVGSSPAMAAVEGVGRVDEINISEGHILISDHALELNQFTIVRNYGGDEDSRLPLSQVSEQDWIRFFYEFQPGKKLKLVKIIEFLSGEQEAEEIKYQMIND